MKIEELIRKFQQNAIEENGELTKNGLEKLKTVLEEETHLRIFFSRASGFGHQANTLTILKRFIGLGYTGGIQVIYDSDTSASPTTIQKLAILIPGLNADNPQPIVLDGVELTFHPYTESEAVPKLEPALLCVNGGAEIIENMTKYFSVEYYLQLQPFMWTEGKNLLWKKDEKASVNLDEIETLGKNQLIQRAFYTDVKPLVKSDWDNLKLVPDIDKKMLQRAEVIANFRTNVIAWPINLIPIYGLPTGAPLERRALVGSNTGILFSLISTIGLLQKMRHSPINDKPTVIAVMTNFYKEGHFWVDLKKLFEGVEDSVDLDELDFLEKREYYAKKWAHENGLCADSRVKFFSAATGEVFVEVLRKARNTDIIITSISNAPQLLFNYIYSLSTLPCIFEGQGTANLLLNLGIPYWQMAKSNVVPYPTQLLTGDYENELTRSIASDVAHLQGGFYVFDSTATPLEFFKLVSRLKTSIDPESEDHFYYSSLAGFYHQDVNDKLLMTVLYLINNFKLDYQSNALTAVADNPLEAFYNTLLANDSNGTLDFIPGVLTQGTLRNYLIGIIGNPKLAIGNAENKVVITFSESKDKIIVEGNTVAFVGVDLTLQLVFTLTEDTQKINTTASLQLGTIEFPEIPWFSLNNTVINVSVPGNGDRITGKAELQINFGSTAVDFSVDFPTDNDVVLATGNFGDNPPAIEDLFQVLGGINFVQSFPPPLNVVADLGLKSLYLGYDYKSKKIESFNVDLETKKSWPLFGKLTIDKLDIKVNVVDPIGERSVSWSASSSFMINQGQLDVGVTYPNLTVTAVMPESSTPIPVGDFLTFFLSPDVTLDLSTNVSNFSLEVKPGEGSSSTTYIVDVSLETESWDITLNDITFGIASLGVNVSDSGSGPIGKLSGSTVLFKNDPKLKLLFFLSASYLGKGNGWLFEGKQGSNPIHVKEILAKYVSLDWANNIPEIDVSNLYFQLQTQSGEGNMTTDSNSSGTAQAYEIGGSVKVWDTPLGKGFSSTITAKFGYRGGSQSIVPRYRISKAEMPVLILDEPASLIPALASSDTKTGPYGEVSAEIKWNNIDLLVSYNFDPTVKCFEVTWGILTGKIEEKEIKNKEGKLERHQIASLSFTQSTSLGSMIETMVSWATGSKFSLGAPWNILDKIPLSNFEIDWDFTDETVKFVVNIGPIDLGFVTIKSIGIAYDKDPDEPTKKRVMIDLDATFIWGEKIPKWDATKPETTPSPRGSGNRFLDLRMLAMGQHVTFDGYKDVESVQKAIELMEKMPEPKPDEVPAITFDPNSSWLFGTDFGVLRIDPPKPESKNKMVLAENAPEVKPAYVLTLQIIFNDPNLYALRIALAGDAVKIFKGLDFQIMYKKLSENIGVYKTEITLPDIMRYIKAGQFNITLPVFGIEIYTNSDFKIDIGFPWNEDFTRSFSICGIVMAGPVPIPLTGAGGIYFGKVPQIATSNVPEATNGHFNPILIFGFGAQFGLGYEIHYGILNAGFSLTMFGILEGLLSKWNPYDGKSSGGSESLQLQGEYFFWVRGTFGIIGKIFGNVDFSVIKVEVELTIKIYAQITFASYEPIPISVVASVDASASLTINLGLFKIHLHFSFSVRIKETITIDAAQGTAPWHVAAATNKGRLASPMANRLSGNNLALFTLIEDKAWTPNWSSLDKPASREQLSGYMSFALTVAGDSAYSKDNPPDLKKQVPCYVASMFIDSVPAATLGDNTSELKAAGDKPDTPFEKLAKLVAVWAIASLTDNGQTPEQVLGSTVSEEDLKKLEKYFYDTKDHPTPVPAVSISKFLTDQVFLTLSMPKESGEADAAFFPMALPLSLERLAYGDTPQINYSLEEYNAIDPDFISWLREYFNQLAVQVQKETGKTSNAILLDSNSDISVGNFVFTDYFLLIMRQMIKSLLEGLRTFKKPIDLNESCNDILGWVVKTGKLAEGVFTLHDIFEGNSSHKLNANLTLVIPASTYTVKSGDSFKSIADTKKFGNAFDGIALAKNNADTPNLMASGKTITYNKTVKHIVTGSATLNSLAQNVFEVSLDELLTNSDIIDGKDLIESFVSISLPDYNYTTVATDTVNSVVATHGITIEELAGISKNGDVKGLFLDEEDSKLLYLDLVHLPQFQVKELLNEAQRTKALEHLSCMVSRYYFHGMRLPTGKITPKQEGMWVTKDEEGNLHLPSTAGLFALTGQQIAIPTLTKDPFTLSVARPKTGLDWLTFEKNVEKLTLTIKAPSADSKNDDPTVDDYKRITALHNYATTNVLDTGLTHIGTERMVSSKEAVYPLSSSIPCQSTTQIAYPIGGALENDKPRLWNLPDAIMSLSRKDSLESDPCPCFNLETHQYNEATGATSSAKLEHYGWATSIEFTIKRLPQSEIKGAYQNTYEISGAGGKQVLLLERLVQCVKDNDKMFSQVILSYNSGRDKNSALRTETGSSVTMGISQVNLSTVTRPPTSNMVEFFADIEDDATNLLNKPSEFVRLLWEACITRAGGFYLYYNDANDGGLPDMIFNDKNEANVSLLVIHKPVENNQLRNYMNSVLIGDPIDLKTSAVVAQTISSDVTHNVGSNESIYSIAMRYYSNVLSLEELNSEIKLAKGAKFTLANGTYLVSKEAPGGKLADIANYFQMDEDEIKSVNPRIDASGWVQGLEIGIPIRLPKTFRTVGTHPGGDNIQTIAKYYGSSTAAIAGENRFVINLLATGQKLTIATGPLTQAGSNPPGVQTISATRPALPPFPDDPASTNYAKNYLLYLYTMLGYTIDGNQDFLDSNIGLPLGTKGKPANDDMDKIRAVKQTNGTEPLEYSKSIHYAEMLSDGYQKPVKNIKPYESNGRLLQFNYCWQDLYGNRIVSRLDQKAPNYIDTKQPILTGYTDTLIGLSQWQSMSTSWTVDKSSTPDKSFLLKTIISFDPSAYIKPGGTESKDWQHNAFTSLATYNTLLDQLNDPNGIDFWFETSLTSKPVPVPKNQIFPEQPSSDKSHILVSWLTDIRNFLQTCYTWQSGPAPTPPEVKEITLQAEVNKTELSTKQLYKLTFQLAFGRTGGVAEGDFAAIPAVQKSASPITPITNVKVNENNGDDDPAKPELQQFTSDIENVLSSAAKYTLTVATGEDRHASSNNEKATNVWAVRFGDNVENGISFSIPDNVPPQIFAPKPISNKLITKSANVFDYSSPDDFDPVENKFTGTPHKTTFTDIELDKWVRQFFTDFDNLLSPEFTSSILVIDKKTNAHPSGVSSFIDSFNKQKKILASVAKELMSPVYQKQESTRLESAKETLYQELLVKLSNFYSTRAAVSFGAKVNADILDDNQNTDQTPKLYGNITWQEGNTDVKSQVVLTSPKLGLKNSDETPLTFLVEAPTQIKSDTSVVLPSLSLALCYNGTAIEHQIAEVSGIKDYKASTWLSFVNPITAQKLSTQLITFEIPMFIRSFPLSPRMDVQTGSATNTNSQSLADLTKWDYKFTYGQDFHYIQDNICGKIEYNIRENTNVMLASFMEAFESLAQSYSMKDSIQKFLRETVPEIDTSSSQEDIDKAAKVLGAYLKMVSDIASQASDAGGFSLRPFLNDFVGDENSYEFHIEESEKTFKPDDQRDSITAWVVTIVSENKTPPTGLSANPYIEIEGITTQSIKDKDLTKQDEGIYAYWFKQKNKKPLMGKDAQVIQARTLVMPGLQILQRQDAKSLTSIKRNIELVHGHPSDDPFIYQTPEVTFSNPLHPTINSDQSVNIADIDPSGMPRSINEHLTALFLELFKGSKDTVTLQVESYYEYSPNMDLSGISIPVPILMQPPLTVDLVKKTKSGPGESTPLISDMINQLSSGIEFWFAENNPNKDNGTIRFKVLVMSNLTYHPMPILILTNLYLGIKDVSDVK